MANYITVDGGTTNTRVSLVMDGKVCDTIKYNVGAKVGIDNADCLKNAVKEGILKLLDKFGLTVFDIERVLAGGMITSEHGLCNVPHIEAPAGISELKRNVKEVVLPEICDVPFVFIPGVKVGCDNLDTADMMRGEEAELVGMMKDGVSDCVYVMPGSHSKIVTVDAFGRIVDFKTMMTGEMIAALSGGTILKSSVDLGCDTVDEEYLVKGFDSCRQNGINNALFKVRVLNNMFGGTKLQVYSFFLGVILAEEIVEIEKQSVNAVVIGGREQIKRATAILLKRCSQKNIIEVSAEDVDMAPSRGMVKIYEYEVKNG
ncbi:MAG: 2-dehydro-3-deoxygalactonokinase [Clostridia bacterium]|nr:2-dehydro-3-deoxygalactonokinase [Clostridia bacterium]